MSLTLPTCSTPSCTEPSSYILNPTSIPICSTCYNYDHSTTQATALLSPSVILGKLSAFKATLKTAEKNCSSVLDTNACVEFMNFMQKYTDLQLELHKKLEELLKSKKLVELTELDQEVLQCKNEFTSDALYKMYLERKEITEVKASLKEEPNPTKVYTFQEYNLLKTQYNHLTDKFQTLLMNYNKEIEQLKSANETKVADIKEEMKKETESLKKNHQEELSSAQEKYQIELSSLKSKNQRELMEANKKYDILKMQKESSLYLPSHMKKNYLF